LEFQQKNESLTSTDQNKYGNTVVMHHFNGKEPMEEVTKNDLIMIKKTLYNFFTKALLTINNKIKIVGIICPYLFFKNHSLCE
jgi:hypothetical protein